MTLDQVLCLILPKEHLGGTTTGTIDDAVRAGVIDPPATKSKAALIRERKEAERKAAEVVEQRQRRQADRAARRQRRQAKQGKG